MEIERNLFDGRILTRIAGGRLDLRVVQFVDHHINAQMRMPAARDVALQFLERALAADFVVIRTHAVHADPYGMGVRTGERQLRVGRNRGCEEADFTRQVAEVVHGAVAVTPQEGFSPLEVHETGAARIRAPQLPLHLRIGLAEGFFARIDRAVLATQVATVGQEQHRLQRPVAAQQAGAQIPPR